MDKFIKHYLSGRMFKKTDNNPIFVYYYQNLHHLHYADGVKTKSADQFFGLTYLAIASR